MFSALARRLGHHRWFARVFRVLVPADRLVGRLTGGRLVALNLVPSLLLTTTGRRSGRPRTSPLVYVADRDGFVVVGSNWGQAGHPAWAMNLRADPAATITLDGRRIPVHAELVTGPDRERLWGSLLAQWPAYRAYARRAGRPLMLFRLRPRPGPD